MTDPTAARAPEETKAPVHNRRACGEYAVPNNNVCICPCPDCMANHQGGGKR